jgi:hypothetical protein
MKEHEKNYATHDLELVAIVHALRKWRHYLMGRRLELRTDHNGLKYLFDQPTLNASRAGGWSFCVNTTLISSISKGRKTRWSMHSKERCTTYML